MQPARLEAEDVRRRMPRPVGVGLRREAKGDPRLPLCPLEEESLGPRAVERRRRSFALGRTAARDALTELGIATVGVGRGGAGQPLWPEGIVGAISHSGQVAMAVVGRRTDYAGLGVDVEQLSPGLSARAARLVCTPHEQAWIDVGSTSSLLTMLFSAKEAVFKATFPLAGIWLGFGDAELTWVPERHQFVARLLKAAGPSHPIGTVLDVYCTLSQGEVLSTTYLLAEPSVT